MSEFKSPDRFNIEKRYEGEIYKPEYIKQMSETIESGTLISKAKFQQWLGGIAFALISFTVGNIWTISAFKQNMVDRIEYLEKQNAQKEADKKEILDAIKEENVAQEAYRAEARKERQEERDRIKTLEIQSQIQR